MDRNAYFVVHLLQDVQVLRPLIFMATRDFGFLTQLLVSDRFRARDTTGIWLNELETICAETGAALHFFGDDLEARSQLQGEGLLFAASESHVHNHAIAHNIFRHAPATLLKVTLQHGFECVGFRHSTDHVRAYGKTASFAADIVCAWYGGDHLTALAPSQAPKVVVTGPTSVLQMATGSVGPRLPVGLVCENLHSVRFESAHKLEQEFLGTFRKFAGAMHRQGQKVRLRPHPGGQYSAKATAVLPRNVELENAPLYRLDLRQFSYGISPPSSVLIDMLLAGIPTAVWRDERGRIDVGNYDGLTTVTSAEELIRFAQDAERNRQLLVKQQWAWLAHQGMPVDPADVYARYAQLFEAAERMEVRRPGSRIESERILVLTSEQAQLAPGVEEGVAASIANGEFAYRVIDVAELASMEGADPTDVSVADRLARLLSEYDPSMIFLCGRAVGIYKTALGWAKSERVPVIYVVGTESASVGPEEFGSSALGEEIETVTDLLHEVDVIYAPTQQQKARLERAFPKWPPIVAAANPAGRERKMSSASRRELMELIARGHAAVGHRDRQGKEEVRVCHVP